MATPGPTPEAVRRRRQIAGVVLLVPFLVLGYLGMRAAFFPAADTNGARVLELTVESTAVGEDIDVDIVVPEGGSSGRPLLVFLHGSGGSSESFTENEALFEALDELGSRAPVIVFPDGGEDRYWHDRADGDWGSYVVDEAIPTAVQATEGDASRVAIGGISMGGFGAYDLALRHPRRFCAVGGHSPALWLSAGATAPGAFDDAEDFERHDVIEAVRADPGSFGGIPVWSDAGFADPFLISAVAFSDALEKGDVDLTAQIWPGAHDLGYWDEHWDEYLGFYASSLADC
ncbi:MAG TPA: alpha/beta hydrolase-fold protein [Solirubrobacterales bacterium]